MGLIQRYLICSSESKLAVAEALVRDGHGVRPVTEAGEGKGLNLPKSPGTGLSRTVSHRFGGCWSRRVQRERMQRVESNWESNLGEQGVQSRAEAGLSSLSVMQLPKARPQDLAMYAGIWVEDTSSYKPSQGVLSVLPMCSPSCGLSV